jgi:hypothetical protein
MEGGLKDAENATVSFVGFVPLFNRIILVAVYNGASVLSLFSFMYV